MADLINKPEYKQVSITNAKINYKIENGRIYTKPFNIKMGGQTMSLSGSTGIDQTIDYAGKLMVPRKDLGAANTAVEGLLAQLNKQAGANIKLNEVIPVQLNIGGTFTNPTVSTNLSEAAKSETESLKTQALDVLKSKKKEAEEKVKAEAEKLKKEAEENAETELAEGAENEEEENEEDGKEEEKEIEEKELTEEQKQIVCQLIDNMPGKIYLSWDAIYVSKKKAKKYVMEYPK